MKLLRIFVAVGLALGLFLLVGCGDDKGGGVGPTGGDGTTTGGTTGGETTGGGTPPSGVTKPPSGGEGNQDSVWVYAFVEKYGSDFDDAAKRLFREKYEAGFDELVARGVLADINKSDIVIKKGERKGSDGLIVYVIDWITEDQPYYYLPLEPHWHYAIDDSGNLYEQRKIYVGDGAWKGGWVLPQW